MFDFTTVKLMHPHGKDFYPMAETSHHDAAQHDPERSWQRGARIFRCSRCEEEIVVLPPGVEVPESEHR